MSGGPDDEYEQRYMDPGERVLFREKVVSRTAFKASVAFALIFGLVGLVALGSAAVTGGAAATAGVAFGAPFVALGALMGVLGVMFSVFRVMVTGPHVHVHFGWSKRKIPMGAIQAVQAVQLRGFRQGKVSMGMDGVVRTWVGHAGSGRGVEITYQMEGARKHILTIGSDVADELARTIERARAAAGVGEPARMRIDAGEGETAAVEQENDVGEAVAPERSEASREA